MSAYYSNLSNQREVLPMSFLPDQKFASYQSTGLSDSPVHLNQHSASVSYSELPSQNYGEVQTMKGKDEMLFIPPTSESGGMQPIGRAVNAVPNFLENSVMMDPHSFPIKQLLVPNGEQSLQNQGLSLSLGTQVPPSLHVYSYQDDYTNSSLSSLVGTHVLHSDQGSENKESKVAEYLSFDLAGGSRAANNPQSSMTLRELNSGVHSHVGSGAAAAIYNSKYLKAAQDLLDEVVNVQEALKQSDKLRNFNLLSHDRSEEADFKSSSSATGISDDHNNSTKGELSATERHDLESKMTKLFSMLDEVDRRYKEYYQQMQVVVSSFEMVAGLGAAKPYTSLALKTISRQFRCLRDAIKKQIQVTRRSLGEQGDSQGERLYRLRYVDQQLRQQRSLQQFGMMRQPWRPQRGLPETAVSVLRAWLFEHFLHPYPKDSEKIMLARQTGLTRSQVANWFINARVRLWKPMIEDMYKEEFGVAEAGSGASPERVAVDSKEKSIAENTGEDIPESFTIPAANCSHLDPSDESSNIVTNVHNNSFTTKFSFQDGDYEHDRIDCGSNKLQSEQIPIAHRFGPKPTSDGSIIGPVNTYHPSMLGDIMGNQVSLALRLQNSQMDQQPISGRPQLRQDEKTDSTHVDISKAAMNQSFSNVCGTESFVSAIGNSKYLKPTQSLLEELVCIGGKTIDSSNEKFIRRLSRNSKKGSLSLRAMLKGEIPPNNELFNERHELYVKIMKLIALLEEVERRYEQYYQHMEEVTSTFEVIAGFGAGKAYTALALQAMSRHFCCLRDSIISQINFIRQKMPRDVPKISSGLSHLSLFEKETLQNRISLQQLGIIQSNRQAWRPIRGLPETSVAILRSWLFEHFLHPYPNDSEKLMLSSQTGLSKNQVSNWFINARVRLWKPMIEEMYKEEFAESSVESDNLLNREAVTDSAEE